MRGGESRVEKKKERERIITEGEEGKNWASVGRAESSLV